MAPSSPHPRFTLSGAFREHSGAHQRASCGSGGAIAKEVLKQKLTLKWKGHRALLLKTQCLSLPSSAVWSVSRDSVGDTGPQRQCQARTPSTRVPSRCLPTERLLVGGSPRTRPAPTCTALPPGQSELDSSVSPGSHPMPSPELGPWVWEARTLCPLRFPSRVFPKERGLAKGSRLLLSV